MKPIWVESSILFLLSTGLQMLVLNLNLYYYHLKYRSRPDFLIGKNCVMAHFVILREILQIPQLMKSIDLSQITEWMTKVSSQKSKVINIMVDTSFGRARLFHFEIWTLCLFNLLIVYLYDSLYPYKMQHNNDTLGPSSNIISCHIMCM